MGAGASPDMLLKLVTFSEERRSISIAEGWSSIIKRCWDVIRDILVPKFVIQLEVQGSLESSKAVSL